MQYAKAIVGALVAGLGALTTALLDNEVALVEWVGVASAALVAGYAVWQTPWMPPDPILRKADEDARREDPRV